MRGKTLLFRIKLLKEAMETKQKQIDNIIESSNYTNKFNNKLIQLYSDIIDYEKLILDYRKELIKIKLK